MNYSLLSLSQLEHAARIQDNALALQVFDMLEEEIENAVEAAMEVNDADYSYKVWDAVNAVQEIQKAAWCKDLRGDSDKITYLIQGLHEDTSPHNNHVVIYKYKGSITWHLIAKGGELGEEVKEKLYKAAGFKAAQEKASEILIEWIKQGFELNF